jgi:hypothetical protein
MFSATSGRKSENKQKNFLFWGLKATDFVEAKELMKALKN